MAFSNASTLDLTACLKQIFTHHSSELSFLTHDDINTLLDEEYGNELPRKSIVGYPMRPLYRDIGNMIQLWFESGLCPITELPSFDLLDEKDYVNGRTEVINEVTPKLKKLKTLFTVWSDDEILHELLDIIKCLQIRGLLDLLGIRKTVGTVEIWPPPQQVLYETFQQPHKPNSDSVLTVGARALAKHCHRDQTCTWWGVSTGSESVKNSHAIEVMERIMDGAIWINIHQLPVTVFGGQLTASSFVVFLSLKWPMDTMFTGDIN